MPLQEDLLNLQFPESVQISPDRQNIVYATGLSFFHLDGDHRLSTLWLAKIGHAASARQLTNGLNNDRAPKWSPNGKSIAFLSDRGKTGVSSAIYVLPLDGGDPRSVTPPDNERSIEAFEFSPDGKTIAYISADEKTEDEKAKSTVQVWGENWAFNRLRLVNVADKTVTILVERDCHLYRFGWNDNGTKIALATIPNPDLESCHALGTTISIVDVATKDLVQLHTHLGDLWDFVSTDRYVYFLGRVSEHHLVSGMMVHAIDLEAKPPRWEARAYGMKNCAMGLKKKNKMVVVQVEEGMENQLRLLDETILFNEKKQITGWDFASQGEGSDAVVVVAMNSIREPPEVYSTTAPTGKLVQLSQHGKPVAGHLFGTTSFVSCPSFDNKVTLDGVWHAPPGHEKQTTPLPTVVIIHGGPYSRHTDSIDNSYFMYAPVLLEAGYAILVPNYRGSSSRGDEFASLARGAGKIDYEDVIALTQHVVEKGYADKGRLAVGGWSYGGFMSYLCAVRNGLHGHGWKFQAVFPGAGISDPDAQIMSSDQGFWSSAVAGTQPWLSETHDTTNRRASAFWEFGGAVKRGNVIPPMLILHGERDTRVALEQATGMRRALQSANLPFEYAMYVGEPHIIMQRKHLLDIGERILAFVEKYLGKASSP